MNDEYFAIYEFRFKNKNSLPLVIYARTEEMANKILEWWNKDMEERDKWYKPRFFFKKLKYINIPPYEFEMAQLEGSEEMYEHRKQYMNEDKTDRM